MKQCQSNGVLHLDRIGVTVLENRDAYIVLHCKRCHRIWKCMRRGIAFKSGSCECSHDNPRPDRLKQLDQQLSAAAPEDKAEVRRLRKAYISQCCEEDTIR